MVMMKMKMMMMMAVVKIKESDVSTLEIHGSGTAEEGRRGAYIPSPQTCIALCLANERIFVDWSYYPGKCVSLGRPGPRG